MADQSSPYHDFIRRLREVNPRQAVVIDDAFRNRSQTEFLVEVGRALQAHPQLISPGHKEDTVLTAAEGIFQAANPEIQKEGNNQQQPKKAGSIPNPFSLNSHGGGYEGVPEKDPFVDDLLTTQKATILKKLSDTFDQMKAGKMTTKDGVLVLREVVKGLSFENMLQGQRTILLGAMNNTDIFNSREADRENLLLQVNKAYDQSIETLTLPANSGKFTQHELLTYSPTHLIDSLESQLRDVMREGNFGNILQTVSQVIDHQQKEIKPLLPKVTAHLQQDLPPEFYAYLSTFLSQESRTWIEVILPNLSYTVTESEEYEPEEEESVGGGSTGGYQTGSVGIRGRVVNRLRKVAKKKAIKEAKKLGEEAAKQGLTQAGRAGLTAGAEAATDAAATAAGTAGAASSPTWLPWVLIGFAILAVLIALIILIAYLVQQNPQASLPFPASSANAQDVRSITAVASTIQGCEKTPFGFWIPPTSPCALTILGLDVAPRGDLLSFALNVAARFPNYQCGQYIWAAQKYILHWPTFPGNVGSVFQWYLLHPDHSLPGYSWIPNPDIINHQHNPADIAPGDIILYGSTGRTDPGHIAIVTDVKSDKFNIVVTEANYHHGAIDIRPTNLFDNLGRGANILGWWRKK